MEKPQNTAPRNYQKELVDIYHQGIVQLAKNPQTSVADIHANLIALAQEGLAVYPNNAFLHSHLAWILNETGDLEGAIRHLKIAARLAPDDCHYLSTLAYVLCRSERYEEALEILKSITDKDNARISDMNLYGYALIMAGNLEEAEKVLRTVVAYGPSSLTYVANYRYATGQLPQGGLPVDPYEASYLPQIADYARRKFLSNEPKEDLPQEHWQFVLPIVEKKLAESPDDAALQFSRAIVLNGLGRYAEALPVFQAGRRVWLPSVEPANYEQLAIALNGLGRYQEALEIIREALSIYGDHDGLKKGFQDQADIARKALAAVRPDAPKNAGP